MDSSFHSKYISSIINLGKNQLNEKIIELIKTINSLSGLKNWRMRVQCLVFINKLVEALKTQIKRVPYEIFKEIVIPIKTLIADRIQSVRE